MRSGRCPGRQVAGRLSHAGGPPTAPTVLAERASGKAAAMAHEQDLTAGDGAAAAGSGSPADFGAPSGIGAVPDNSLPPDTGAPSGAGGPLDAGAAAGGLQATPGSRPTAESGSPAVGPIRLADGPGVASAGLGAPMLISPERFLNAIGVEPGGQADAITIGVGIRELAATGTINVMRHRRIGAWS